MDKRFKKLFEPIQVGTVTIPNRIYMPAMCTNYAGPQGESSIQDIGYFEARAKGGAGLISVDFSCISPEGRAQMGQRGMWDNSFMPYFTRIVDVIRVRGARVTTQLHHAGVNAMVAQPRGPSRLSNMQFFISKPTELSTQEVEEVIEKFADAALRAKTCGVDMIEIHGSHGYLVSQFMSPIYNQRTDRYGRDRALFAIEIVKRIKEKCSADFPVIFRFNANEYSPRGITLDYSKEVAQRLEQAGVNLLNVTGCNYDTLDYTVPNMYLEDEEGEYFRFIKLGAEIKKVVGIPVVSGGLLTDPLKAEKLLEDGVLDMVFIGKQLIADPDWPRKVRSGRLEDIRPCCACMDGCIGRIFIMKTVWCSVNPMTGFEYRWPDEDSLPKPLKSKQVLVVGAGPAGLETARICAIRGHRVSMIDKADRIGGTVNIAAVPSFKKRYRQLLEWYQTQLGKLGVEIKLETKATPALIRKLAPEVIVMATGSEPLIPDIPGINQAATADEVLLRQKEVGQEVVIIGGGFVGLDTALYLSKQGKRATVVEALSEAGADLEPSVRMSFFRKPDGLIDKYQIKIITGSPVVNVKRNGVETVDALGCRSFIKGDVIIAVGRRPAACLELGEGTAEVHVIGDARAARKVTDAIHEGFTLALDI